MVIFINAVNNFNCDLPLLRQPETRYILITTEAITPKLSAINRVFFEAVHEVEKIAFSTTADIVANYCQHIPKEQITLITANESCMPTLSELAEHFSVKGLSRHTTKLFTNKLMMKERLIQAGIRVPKFMPFDLEQYHQHKTEYLNQIEQSIPYPFIAKPVSLVGGASVTIISSKAELTAWANKIVHSPYQYEMEEYISGKLYECDTIIQNSKIIFTSVCEYAWPVHFYKEGFPIGSLWLPPSETVHQKLSEFNQKIIDCLQPPDGATHCEIFISDKDESVFLEIAARTAGVLVTPQIEHITGVNMELEHFKARLHIPSNIQQKLPTDYFSWVVFPKKLGKIVKLIPPILQSEYHIDWHAKVGDVTTFRDLQEAEIAYSTRGGVITFQNTNFLELKHDFEMLRHHQFIEAV